MVSKEMRINHDAGWFIVFEGRCDRPFDRNVAEARAVAIAGSLASPASQVPITKAPD
jgi:hypothetical protein